MLEKNGLLLQHHAYQRVAMNEAMEDAASLKGWVKPFAPDIDFIDKDALIAQLGWVGSDGAFEWWNLASQKFHRYYAIDFAIRYRGELCGLCLAYARPGSKEISIDSLQGNPSPEHSLKGLILPLSQYVLSVYGTLLKATQIVVEQPLPGSETAYRRNGFERDGDSFTYEIPGV